LTPRRGKKRTEYAILSAVFAAAFVLMSCAANSVAVGNGVTVTNTAPDPVLRIYDWQTGEVYIEHPVLPGDELYFGWIHSLEKIPWDEYYHIDEELNLILDTIRFPAFGAGIPENKGTICYIKDGLIYMSGINQMFTEFDWMNSQTGAQEIHVAGEFVTRGSELPKRRLVLKISRRNPYGG
jgi:hypothetical protein